MAARILRVDQSVTPALPDLVLAQAEQAASGRVSVLDVCPANQSFCPQSCVIRSSGLKKVALRFQAKRLLISVPITVCLSRHPPSNLDHLPDAVNLHVLDQPTRYELARFMAM